MRDTPSEQGVFSCKRIFLTTSLTDPYSFDMTRWTVTYQIKGNDKVFGSNCVLQEGRTTMNDIPKMIAIKRGVDESQIHLLTLIREADEN